MTDLGDRIHVIGGGGSGKTTLARKLAAARGLPLWELDRQGQLEEIAKQPKWVMEGIFLYHVELAFERATAIIWLDLPQAIATRRIVTRHIGLSLRRRNRYPGLRALIQFVADQRAYYTRGARVPESATDWTALSRAATERALEPFRDKVVRLATPSEVRRFSRRTDETAFPSRRDGG
jgi:adenylate kinase family enzyme